MADETIAVQSGSRSQSLALLSIAIVLGVSLLDLVVPPLGIPLSLLTIWGLYKYQKSNWQPIGLSRPDSWGRTILVSVGVVIFLKLFNHFLLDPLIEMIIDVPKDLSAYESVEGDHMMLIVFLTVSWTTAGFGEEIIFRGFLMSRLACLLNSTRTGWAVGLTLQSVIFGLIHVKQGPAGMIQTGVFGFVLGLTYLLSNKNLWVAYFAHALTNTISFLLLYTGLYRLLI